MEPLDLELATGTKQLSFHLWWAQGERERMVIKSVHVTHTRIIVQKHSPCFPTLGLTLCFAPLCTQLHREIAAVLWLRCIYLGATLPANCVSQRGGVKAVAQMD